jgi:3-hydroxybutyryl-CoA dehydrogenase
LGNCDLLIEAIIEAFDIKMRVLRDLIPSLRRDCIIASNTSSLSITKIGDAISARERTVGMHFFNPAPVMKLVEVVAGKESDPSVVDRVTDIARAWGKVVARANDVPGFIVNHVARPYYLEAFRILEDGLGRISHGLLIDAVMKNLGGFRMGPLELTDLIGQDVNTATTRSVWEQLGKPPLLAPSEFQEQLVSEGRLGRKTKRGVYDYSTDPPAVTVDSMLTIEPARDFSDELSSLALDFSQAATGTKIKTAADSAAYILARILVAIIAQAHHAFERGVASRKDIDTAMKFGVNYPKGPFEWTDQIGKDRCIALLRALNDTVRDDRFAVPRSLES